MMSLNLDNSVPLLWTCNPLRVDVILHIEHGRKKKILILRAGI